MNFAPVMAHGVNIRAANHPSEVEIDHRIDLTSELIDVNRSIRQLMDERRQLTRQLLITGERLSGFERRFDEIKRDLRIA